MTYYFDTSVLFPLIVRDSHSVDASLWFERVRPLALVSSFTVVEFSAVVSRHVRSGQFTVAQGIKTLTIFDEWLRRNARLVTIYDADIVSAGVLVRDFDCKLLAPDALHLSVSKRLNATLVTFDKRMVDAATFQTINAIVPS